MNKINKRGVRSFFVFFLFVILLSSISAGVGIKWTQESAMVNEGEETCLTYYVYNPWGEDSTFSIGLSEELQEVLTMQETEEKTVLAQTSSQDALPVKFCFKVPQVYDKDCLIGDFVCEQKCGDEQKLYEGEVLVSSHTIGNQGGSSTKTVVSAPLRIRVKCNPQSRDYTILFVAIAIVALIVVILLLRKKYGKPKAERLKDQMKKLRAEMRKSKKSKK